MNETTEHNEPTAEADRVDRAVIFDPRDVVMVAKAMLENHSYFDSGDYSKDQYVCEHCGERSPPWHGKESDIKHGLDCPVLIARDLLTGFDGR